MNLYALSTLLEKTHVQLDKELARRGLNNSVSTLASKEVKVQHIIEYDAYWEGVNDARKGTLRNGKAFEGHFKQPGQSKRHLCFLTGENDDYPTAMRLTQEQANLARYLLKAGFLGDAVFVQSSNNDSEIVAP